MAKKSFFHTKSGKTTLNYAYSFGAALVILGALFKINHWPFATEMLIVGMGTEVLIFLISGGRILGSSCELTSSNPFLIL